MPQALYRKYRSKSLSEIVGQEHITTTLNNALQKGNISHAYLFTGPRGVGKTSIARILAHDVNQLPYDEDSNHLDIIEIDAASNRRIDEIRDLRERVHIAPTQAKYKVYIIDEVHMLTKEAFNALLKTLEEPPAHVIFILATTEAHKLPETIVSRTQRFTFKPIESQQALAHLRSIAKSEGIQISDEALKLIIEHGAGSFRDSISLLDQASSMNDAVEVNDVQQMFGIAPVAGIDQVLHILQAGSAQELLAKLVEFRTNGYNAAKIAGQIGEAVRRAILDEKLDLPYDQALELLQSLLKAQASHDPTTALEISLLTVVLPRSKPAIVIQNADSIKQSVDSSKETKAEKVATATVQPTPSVKETVNRVNTKKVAASSMTEQPPGIAVSGAPINKTLWLDVLAEIKKTHNTLYSVARMAEASFNDEEVTLYFSFPFHHKRINDAKNKQVLIDVAQRLTGRPLLITCILDKNRTPQQPAAVNADKAKNPVDTISNIFGGAEVLE